MGLFSKKEKPLTVQHTNLAVLQKQISDLAGELYELRHDAGSVCFVKYVRTLLDMEILALASEREMTSESFAYHRGRIDSFRSLLDNREIYISKRQGARSKDDKENTDEQGNYNYLRSRSTAGPAL